jgi:PKD repeat protein
VTPFLDSAYGVYPYTTGYANTSIEDLLRAASSELDEDVRSQIYSDMGMLVYEDAPYMWLWQGGNFHIERSWVDGYYYNAMYSGLYYAALSKVTSATTEPHAEFTVTPSFGDTSTLFVLDATGSSDLEDDASVLEYRWDWEGDGVWDTDWSLDEDATHQYLAADTYTVMLEVRDTGGLVGSASEDVVVSDVAIPEFTTVLIPVVAVLALFVMAMRRREAA